MVRGYYRRLDDAEQPVRKLAALIANVNRAPDHPGYEPRDLWPLRSDAALAASEAAEEPLSLEQIFQLDTDLL